MKRTTTFFIVTIFLDLLLETNGMLKDPWAFLAWHYQADLSSWIGIRIVATPLEISIIVAMLLWLGRSQMLKRTQPFQPGTLIVPVLAFGFFVLAGLIYGKIRPWGNFTVGLWEVRGFLMLIAVYLATGMFIRSDRDVNRLVWTVLVSTFMLSVENILRWRIYLKGLPQNDLAYDHVDSVLIDTSIILCVGLFAFGGTRKQQRFAMLALPVFMFALLVMKRRAAFPVLAIGLIVLSLFILRLRPHIFWRFFPPVAAVIGVYLALFWRNTSVWGQPARAVSSLISPDPRDYASNLYRTLEKMDIVANIKSAPFLGLGFGQPFHFYYSLPNLSFWPFWRYTTHNAILWIWMKDGILGFIAFWILVGLAAYEGSKVVETQREEWALVRFVRRVLAGRRGAHSLMKKAPVYGPVLLRQADDPRTGRRTEHSRTGPLGLNVPAWERSDSRRSVTARRSGTLALLVTAISLIPMQVMYSYVDLGLTSERCMLLFGLMLGLIANGHQLLELYAAPEPTFALAGRSKRATRRPSASAHHETLAEATKLVHNRRTPSRVTVSAVPTRPDESEPAGEPQTTRDRPRGFRQLRAARRRSSPPAPTPPPNARVRASNDTGQPDPDLVSLFSGAISPGIVTPDDEGPLPWEP